MTRTESVIVYDHTKHQLWDALGVRWEELQELKHMADIILLKSKNTSHALDLIEQQYQGDIRRAIFTAFVVGADLAVLKIAVEGGRRE